jgi:hypothetical protein
MDHNFTFLENCSLAVLEYLTIRFKMPNLDIKLHCPNAPLKLSESGMSFPGSENEVPEQVE